MNTQHTHNSHKSREHVYLLYLLQKLNWQQYTVNCRFLNFLKLWGKNIQGVGERERIWESLAPNQSKSALLVLVKCNTCHPSQPSDPWPNRFGNWVLTQVLVCSGICPLWESLIIWKILSTCFSCSWSHYCDNSYKNIWPKKTPTNVKWLHFK